MTSWKAGKQEQQQKGPPLLSTSYLALGIRGRKGLRSLHTAPAATVARPASRPIRHGLSTPRGGTPRRGLTSPGSAPSATASRRLKVAARCAQQRPRVNWRCLRIEIYSQRAVSKLLAGKPDGWNREHLWPRSYGLTYGPSLTDLHNIRPADVNVNSSRGNKYYGECSATSVRCVRPANQEAAPDTETDAEKWAPPFQVRGDIARSLMYMAVSYGSSQNDGTPHLELSESPNIQTSTFIGESQQSWVNEFHYENKGKDENEFVELVVHMPFDVKELMLVLYNGANGQMYRSLNLADKEAFTVTEISSDYLLYTVCTPLQNGPADGIALVYYRYNREAEVLQFLSYEGSMIAQDGPAKGMVSTDIMLKETDESSNQDSLGLGGQKIGEFAWRKMVGNATPGKLNAEQTF